MGLIHIMEFVMNKERFLQILVILGLFITTAIAHAEKSRLKYVGLAYQTFFSPNYKFHLEGGLGHTAVFSEYNEKKGDYQTKFSLKYDGNNNVLCDLSNEGNLIVLTRDYDYEVAPGHIDTYDKKGKIISSIPGEECPNGELEDLYGDPNKFSSGKKAELRSVLCKVPANDFISRHGKKYRAYDIFEVYKTLSGEKVLAKIGISPITADNVKFGKYPNDSIIALIDIKGAKENYCLLNSLALAPEENTCVLESSDYSTPFFTIYDIKAGGESSPEPAVNCSLSLGQKNVTKERSKATKVRIDWLKGEYSDNEVIKNFNAPTSTQLTVTDFTLQIGYDGYGDCGYVVRNNPKNPKIRANAYGVGNLWCSHY
jgi:hypothetical protein